jgi:zinc protease
VGDQVELPRVYLTWITGPVFSQADAECDLIAKILGGGKSSRLYKSLVYKKRIAQDAVAHQSSLALGSIFVVEATGKPGVKPQKLEEAIWKELEKFKKNGPKRAELQRARNTIESAIIRALENLGGLADRLNLYNQFLGDPGSLARDMGRYQKASIKSLQDLAQSQFKREACVAVWGVPGTKAIDDAPKPSYENGKAVMETSPVPDQDWRSTPPTPGPTPALNLPIPREFRLGNGLRIFLVEQHGLPIISANVITLSGSDRNPSDQPGLASFAADMLDEGTVQRSPLEIAADADQIGASLSTGASTDYSYIAMRPLKKNAEAAFELVSDILINPAFASEEIERVRHDRLIHILQQKDNPSALAIKAFFDAIYGCSHPYGYMDIGSEESNGAITRDGLLHFYQAGYFAANSALVVAGDLVESELKKLAEKYFGEWTTAGSISFIPAVAVNPARRIVIVEKPGAPQTVLRIGHIGVARSNPDYVAIDVMNTALGGLVSSRLNLNLREKHGFTYGISSAFIFRRGPGPFLVGTSVRTDATAPATAEIFREIERMRESRLSPEELATAKDSMARSLPGMFETTPESASSIGQLFVHDLPLNYYHDLPGQIQSVSDAQVQEAARKYLKPEEMVVVAVGDRGKIESALEKLNLGPIEIRDSSGNPQ